MSASHRSMVFIPLIGGKPWAIELIKEWIEDKETPEPVRRFMQKKGRA